jgi:hypothetical protein
MITYQASLLICSGRPDPVWDLSTSMANALLDHWRQLPPLSEEPVPPACLGYRGCLLISSAGEEWNAFDSAVVRKKDDGSESRYDQYRIFEKMLIKSVPTGMLPSEGIQI